MSVLAIKHNSRQIPSDKSIVGNKQYYDLLFGYLQTESLYDKEENMPYLEKKQVNYTKLAAELKISRQTASKYVKHFEKAKALYGNEEIARKDTLAKLLQDKNINKSIVATVSGSIALILLAKPIDFFVENILMEKLISPALDKMQEMKNQFKQKTKEKAKN